MQKAMDFVREMDLSKFVKNLQENANMMMQVCDDIGDGEKGQSSTLSSMTKLV